MNITEVKIYLAQEEKLKAYVTITIDNAFIVRDLKIIQGTSGLFIAMPAKRRKDGSFQDVAHPLNQDVRARLEEQIFKAYEETLKNEASDAE